MSEDWSRMEYSVLPAQRQRPRRAAGDGRDQPRASRRFYLRPAYLVRHAGDVVRLAVTKWSVAWHVASRVLFGAPVTDAAPPRVAANQRAA